ncbi:MAG: alpha/beta fold hydrolase [Gemmatimonadota bacterium]|nr:alpha/beta fold hydrolase [Gemmatimonadota bacterium]
MLWCLHGFLGQGSDWDGLRATWPADLPPLRSPDLFAAPGDEESLEEFGARFADAVAVEDPTPIVMGYSLGGRLALHALLARPALWRAGVIVSAHLGLAEPGSRNERRAADAAWAERFRLDDWTALLEAWNARDVFGGRAHALPRPESAFDREALARGLETWSLGNQADLPPQISRLPMPILWIAGEEDDRYVAQGEWAAEQGIDVRLSVAPGAAHRVPWEAPDWFAETVSDFIRGLGE